MNEETVETHGISAGRTGKQKIVEGIPITKTVLLKDQGPKLPLGIRDNSDVFHRELVTRPWRMKEERTLGELRDKNRGANMAEYVSMVLASMYQQIGAMDFNKMKFDERRIMVSRMYLGDVMYAYVWLRREALGSTMETEIVCQRCRHRWPFPVDLDTAEVTVAPTLESCFHEYVLQNPFDLRGQKVESITLGPTPWGATEQMGVVGINQGLMKAGIIRGSIHAIAGMNNVVLADHELDEMTKRDIEAIAALIDERNPGPDMSIEGLCEKCKGEFKISIDWNYDSFFAVSSQ